MKQQINISITGLGVYLTIMLLGLMLSGCTGAEPTSKALSATDTPEAVALEKPKILFINSYHEGYEWSDGILGGVMDVLNVKRDDQGALDSSNSKAELSVIYMDTKRNQSEEFMEQAVEEAKSTIETVQPDLVITSDDNAAKYLISPYYKDSDLPVVFTGVNWSAESYGFPADNVTGMLEVILVPQIVETLSQHAKGDRIGYIKGDDASARKDAETFKSVFGVELVEKYVNNFDEWKTAYIALQTESDMILVGNFISVEGFDEAEAKQFIAENTTVPTGNWDDWIKDYTLVTYANKPTEQGEWAAEQALLILDGTSPADIPLVTNQKAKIYLNMPLAKQLGIQFPVELVEQAMLITE
ncbi:ABC transporter substrate binding protein [Anaerolineales bacterium HSG6]|nr:ABC transporter substrate binding protein [Anaerolineales bacterium HSG6]MDM8530471.1 ABC transporter substrate binding protein [Anaerolineales bacterium HSG25]